MNKEETKRQVVKEYLSGSASLRSLGVKYGYSASGICSWVMKEKKQTKKQALLTASAEEVMPDDVKQLREELRVTRIRLQLMEAMIDIADEQLGTQIRKKVGARQS